MIGVDARADLTAAEGLEALLDANQKLVQEVADDLLPYAQAFVTKRLGVVPRPAVHPFQFATPKSRRYYFYLVKTGRVPTDGKRYVRSGKLPNGWRVQLLVKGGEFRIGIFNPARAAQYVYGTLVKDVGRARRRQVAGHRNTGWILASPIAREIVDELDAEFRELLNARIGEEFVKLGRTTTRASLRNRGT
jgi:hypothetical protein